MVVINVALVSACVALAVTLFTVVWKVAHYKNLLDIQVAQNREAIKRQSKDFKYAYRLLENDVFDIQGFLIKTTTYKIRARAEVSGNSGADFLEESEKANDDKT